MDQTFRSRIHHTLRFKSPLTEEAFLERRQDYLVLTLRKLQAVVISLAVLGYIWIVFSPVSRGAGEGATRTAEERRNVLTHLLSLLSVTLALSIAVLVFTCGLYKRVQPWIVECVAVCQGMFLVLLPPMWDSFYATKLLGINPFRYYGAATHFADSRLLLLWVLLQVCYHLLLPIRWISMVPLELFSMLVYCVPLLVGSPEGMYNGVVNFILCCVILLSSASGKRSLEMHERRGMVEWLEEKTQRVLAEHELSLNQRPDKQGNEGSYRGTSQDASSMHDLESQMTLPMSHCVFTLVEESAMVQMNCMREIGEMEKWLIPASSLAIHAQRFLGRGGFGCVVVGYHHGTEVALKVPFAVSHTLLRTLANEIRVLRRTRHPNIVHFFGAYVLPSHGVLLLCEEYVKGCPLNKLLDTPPPELTGDIRWGLLAKMCTALRYLHEIDPCITHGDLKPCNVLVQHLTYEPKLVDFGLASLREKHATRIGGTWRWMAPEVLESKVMGLPPISGGSLLATATDMFSFGLVAFNVVTNLKPMASMALESRKLLLEAGQVPLLEWPHNPVPYQAECKILCERCLLKEPENRATAKDIHACLLAWPRGGEAPTDMRSSPLAECSEELLLLALEDLKTSSQQPSTVKL